MKSRSPAVAGSFYPQNPEDLSHTIDVFLSNAQPVVLDGKLRMLVVPHAGYRFSGSVAAEGYKQLETENYKRVVLLGSSHQVPLSKATIDDSDAWKTPLGEVPLDKGFTENLSRTSSFIEKNHRPHKNEHSLEVQLPFLQKTLGISDKKGKPSFKIVPILIGSEEDKIVTEVSQSLVELIDSQTLIIVSSDLSHYPPYEAAQEVDRKTTDAILTGNPRDVTRAIDQSMSKGISNLATCACGKDAILVGMHIAKGVGANDIRLLKYANSGDVSGERRKVVGYAAIGFFEEKGENTSRKETTNDPLCLNTVQKKQLLSIARETLESVVNTGNKPLFEVEDSLLEQELGVFVTLKKNNQLRGCMGIFEPNKPLWNVVQDQTEVSALKDPRFPPVQPEELADIEIEISIIAPPKQIEDPNQIKLGEDGVMIRRGQKSGTFLPQVAKETSWDLETFLCQLCASKAGLYKDAWKDPETEIYTYSTETFSESDFDF
ncbi:MAG: AmmeMemoRadiSam system protein B [Patescibacteria group bacterium]|nr:AmmeMemoRadiSam system protein B [Patescibacteria group bacterium]